MNFLINFISPVLGYLGKNLVNKWSGSGGIMILIYFLINQGILPKETADAINGVPYKQIINYLLIIGSLYLISHIHIINLISFLWNYRITKLQNKIKLDTLKIQEKQLLEKLNNKDASK